MKIFNITLPKATRRVAQFVVLSLPIMLGFQNCSDFVVLDATLMPAVASEDLLLGRKLYSQSCSACHGPAENSAKRNRSAEQITLAISNEYQMRALKISQADIELIAKALNPVKPDAPVLNDNNRQEFACTIGDVQKTPLLKLTNREYRNALNGLLDSFSITLKNDTALIALLNAIPTDIAIQNRDTLKEQSLLMSAAISNALFAASFRASELIAGATTGLQNYPNTSSCLNNSPISQTCHQAFVKELGSLAFRRKLETSEVTALSAKLYDNSLSKADQLKATFTSIAMMPDFLYKIYDRGTPVSSGSAVLSLTAHELATKMAFFITGSPADSTLRALADNNEILKDDILAAQIERLLGSVGAKNMIQRLFRESYGYDVYDRFQFDSAFVNNMDLTGLNGVMTAELDNYFDEVVLNKRGSFLDVMTSRHTNATDSRMGVIYGVGGATSILPEERSGFMTRAAMLTKRTSNTTSPIKRGLNVIEHVLCQDIGLPPPNAPTALPPVLSEELITTRLRTAQATESPGTSCATCHSKFNSFGYALESFDSFGRHRTQETIYENGVVKGQLPVDASYSSKEISGTGSTLTGNNSKHLVEHLGVSDRAMMCFVQHLKRFEARVPAEASANCQMNRSLKTMYGDNTTQGSITDAIKSLVLSPEFRRWKN